MFLEKIRSEGLAHLSYVVGHGGRAAVVDPRRDQRIYRDVAARQAASITHIFETHRNEDYVSGAKALSHATGAKVYHGKALDFAYGVAVSENDEFEIGDLVLRVIETPGHTYESISISVADRSFGNTPVAVFTGDALFSGDVGRTDFFPDRAEAVAGLLYDSLFKKLLPLGDHVILLPAHGAGSVCGSGMADREFTTIGYERLHNPALKTTDREAFIRRKCEEQHYQPPYFRQMERLNKAGASPSSASCRHPAPLGADTFEAAMQDGMAAIDIRSAEAFAGAYIPDSLAIPLHMLPSYAGWFLSYDHPIGLIADRYEDAATACTYLMRLGYDQVRGYLGGGLKAWEVSGRLYDRIPAVHAAEVVDRTQETQSAILLDVRTKAEVEAGHLPRMQHVFLGELPQKLPTVAKDKPVITFCGSGQRAIIAASILKQHGFSRVENSLVAMAACAATDCPLVA